MKTKEFIHILENNPNKELVFEYQSGKLIGANYHLTEVKNVHFNTVDCGGNPNEWKETQVQLWESPSEIGKTTYLTTTKAAAILHRVDSIQPLWLDTELKIEFGNENFHTSVLKIQDYKEKPQRITFQLFEEKTLCKAPSEINEETSCCDTNTVSNCCS